MGESDCYNDGTPAKQCVRTFREVQSVENQVERLKVGTYLQNLPRHKTLVDVSLSVMSGEVRALVGENGAR